MDLQDLIKADYELFGHRDGRLNTSCPGDALYDYIHTWSHYSTRHIHKYGVEAIDSSSGGGGGSKGFASSLQKIINVVRSRDDRDTVQQL